MPIPRPEYPRPILQRNEWLNLNGEWSFDYDPDDDGLDERWFDEHDWSEKIIVPFSVESEASGLHDTSPPDILWYQRTFEVPDWNRERVLLNVGACDYWSRVFINGLEVGQHRGGYSPFSLDITHALVAGTNQITIRVQDSNSWMQPRGKQEGTTRWPIDYDAVTGIWQTVWLEPVNKDHITETAISYHLDDATFSLLLGFSRHFTGDVEVSLLDAGGPVATSSQYCDGRSEVRVSLALKDPKLWSPERPSLYDLKLKLSRDSIELDSVHSYAGLREVLIKDGRILLNGAPIYLRGILDQGYFPGGWYTPVDDQTIQQDIELTKAMGFNLARKHQKAEDPRYLYWADKLGLMIWAEMPSGKIFSTELIDSLSREWMALVRRDRAHPCIISWVPFNESWGVWHQSSRPEQRAFVDAMVALTHSLDPSRPVIGNDGWEYSSGDFWTLHLYESTQDESTQDESAQDESAQDTNDKSIANRLDNIMLDPTISVTGTGHARAAALPGTNISGLPVLLTECGGIGFLPDGFEGDEFAYGSIAETTAELEDRFHRIANSVNDARMLSGFVWTQLTDIQQEVNGVLYFDRTPKLPLATLHKIFTSIGKSG